MTYRENAYQAPAVPLEIRRARRWMAIGAGFDAIGGGLLIVVAHQIAQGLILGGAAVGLLFLRHLLGRMHR